MPPEGLGTFGAESEVSDRIPVPIYNPDDQFTVEQLKERYPEWAEYYGWDAELAAISVERTRYFREIGKRTNIGGSIMREIGDFGLEWAVENTPHEIGLGYDAHGIAGKKDAVMELDTLLKTGISPDRLFYTMNFVHHEDEEVATMMGAARPKTKGGFILVSNYGEKLASAGIKFVVVGEEYNRVINILKKRYPQVEIVPWHEAPKIFVEQASRVTGEVVKPPEFNEQTRAYYHVVEDDTLPVGREDSPTEPLTSSEKEWINLPDIPDKSKNNGPDVW